jgi:hypothetical protein
MRTGHRCGREMTMAKGGPGKWVPKPSFVLPDVPQDLQIDPLLLAVLHADAFLQLSEDEAVDPEASEHMGYYLGRLPADRIVAVKADLKKLASYARKQGWPDDAVEFIAEYWDNAVGDGE